MRIFAKNISSIMIIARKRYTDRLLDSMHNGMIKVVTGVRRCGKSFLLFNLFYHLLLDKEVEENHIISIALDDLENVHLLDNVALYQYIKSQLKDDKMHYVLLDEIQLVPKFETVLNSLLHLPNVDCYVTGSNSRFLSSDIITEFRGRGYEIRVYPFSFSEFVTAFEGPISEAWKEYCLYGGMPQCAQMPTVRQKENYLKNLYRQTYMSDIVNRYNLKNDDDLRDLTQTIASSVGSLTNPTNLYNTFKSEKKSSLARNTIVSYINFLEDAFLVDEALRFDIKGKRYINTPVKYYFVDVGLRNALLNFRQQNIGNIMENVIYNELRVRGYSVDVGQVSVTSQNQNGNAVRKYLEVDFVVNQGTKRYYIQSAANMDSPDVQKRETNSLRNIDDAFKKIIITGSDQRPWYSEDGILNLSLNDFLLEDDAIDF